VQELIKREQVLNDIALLLKVRSGERPATPILNLIGPAGSGKSVVLEQLLAGHIADLVVVCLRFDATGLPWEQVVGDLRLLPGLAALPDRAPPQAAALRLRREGAEPVDGAPWLLLLDGVDGLAAWPWLQDTLLRLAVEFGGARLLIASRAPLYWHFWELADLVQVVELPPLTAAAYAHLLPPSLGPELHTELLALSQGYPGSVGLLAQRFGVAPPFDLELLTPLTQAAVLTIGLLRTVQVPVMLAALQQFAGSDEGLWHQQLLTHVLPELKRHGLTSYNRSEQTRFSPALRLAVEARLRLEDTQRLRRLYRFYGEWYDDAAPAHERRVVNEWLYYAACAISEGDERSRWAWRFERLRQALDISDALAAQLLGDGELLARLKRADCLDEVAQLLGEQELRLSLYKHVDALLFALLGVANPEQAEELHILASAAAALGTTFSLAELSAALAQPPHRVSALLAILLQHGVCLPEKRQRYRLHPLLVALVQERPAVPNRASNVSQARR
jgi:hypothetical protein